MSNTVSPKQVKAIVNSLSNLEKDTCNKAIDACNDFFVAMKDKWEDDNAVLYAAELKEKMEKLVGSLNDSCYKLIEGLLNIEERYANVAGKRAMKSSSDGDSLYSSLVDSDSLSINSNIINDTFDGLVGGEYGFKDDRSISTLAAALNRLTSTFKTLSENVPDRISSINAFGNPEIKVKLLGVANSFISDLIFTSTQIQKGAMNRIEEAAKKYDIGDVSQYFSSANTGSSSISTSTNVGGNNSISVSSGSNVQYSSGGSNVHHSVGGSNTIKVDGTSSRYSGGSNIHHSAGGPNTIKAEGTSSNYSGGSNVHYSASGSNTIKVDGTSSRYSGGSNVHSSVGGSNTIKAEGTSSRYSGGSNVHSSVGGSNTIKVDGTSSRYSGGSNVHSSVGGSNTIKVEESGSNYSDDLNINQPVGESDITLPSMVGDSSGSSSNSDMFTDWGEHLKNSNGEMKTLESNKLSSIFDSTSNASTLEENTFDLGNTISGSATASAFGRNPFIKENDTLSGSATATTFGRNTIFKDNK